MPRAVERHEVAVLEADEAGGRLQAQDGAAERRLAGAGFADDAHRLAGADPQAHAVDGAKHVGGLAEEALLEREL